MKKKKYWNDESVHDEALKYDSFKDFKSNSSGACNYAHKHNLMKLICSHMINKRNKWNHKLVKKEALKYKNIRSFQYGNSGAWHYSKRNNLLGKLFPKKRTTK